MPQSNFWNPEGQRFGYIDGDLLVYSACHRHNDSETFDKVAGSIDFELMYLRDTLDFDDFRIYITGGKNFRYSANPQYKANRKKLDKPRWLGECYSYMVNEWGSRSEPMYEADDMLGIALTENPDAILLSYDKDLDQIPGWHHNWRKRSTYHVTPHDGDRFLAQQMLVGDRVDNIMGVKGIGPKKAEPILGDQASLGVYLERVLACYTENELTFEEFEANYKCLKILRSKVLEWPELEEIRPCMNQMKKI